MEPSTEKTHAGSNMKVFAGIVVLVCVAAASWRVYTMINEKNAVLTMNREDLAGAQKSDEDTTDYMALLQQLVNHGKSTMIATSTDPVGEVGVRALGAVILNTEPLQKNGTYTPEKGAAIAKQVIEQLAPAVPYTAFNISEAKTDPDTSYTRMMRYRSDLQIALQPLLKNSKPEIEIFGMYAETKDKKYLQQLQDVAANYSTAASNTAKVIVPADGVLYHTGIINAMRQFAATLTSLATHADDPITTSILLKPYSQAEADMYSSFNALAGYYKSKPPTK